MDRSPGIIAVTKFCRPMSRAFSSYIKYMEREEAARNDAYSKFNINSGYSDYVTEYMDNPVKTTGLFSNGKMELTMEEKSELRGLFQTAQENGSLMWQTVISFDNRWLAEYGLYDIKTGELDELRLKTIANTAINRMLGNEGLENAVWSAAIHYNTDNIHIHVATVEPFPQREIREYTVYKDEKNKIPLLDKEGNPVKQKEPVGMFKSKSIDMCKNYFVNEITNQREQNMKINEIVRTQILEQRKQNPILDDPELTDAFLKLYIAMPREKGKNLRNLWNYNNRIMLSRRSLVDDVSRAYLQKYHPSEMAELNRLLAESEETYRKAYGADERSFSHGKYEDLFTRLGNSIIKEIRELDKKLGGIVAGATVDDVLRDIEQLRFEEGVHFGEPDAQGNTAGQSDEPWEFSAKLPTDPKLLDARIDSTAEYHRTGRMKYDPEIHWTKDYNEAMDLLYDKNPDFEKARALLEEETDSGNPLAAYALGDIYRKGIGVRIDPEQAKEYYSMAFVGFKNGEDKNGFCSNRMGKMYLHGLGVEQNYTAAYDLFNEAIEHNSTAAWYQLGNMYYYGTGIDQDYDEAYNCFDEVSDEDKKGFNPDAAYKVGVIEERGLLSGSKEGTHEDPNPEAAQKYYKRAYSSFARKAADEEADDNFLYRLGYMTEYGKGCTADPEKAQEYYERSANLGNIPAMSKVAGIYLRKGEPELVRKAVRLLNVVVEKSDEPSYAQYSLGKIHSNDPESEFYDMDKALTLLNASRENGNVLASYQLGKIYSNPVHEAYDLGKAIPYLADAAESGNSYAQYSLGRIYSDDPENGFYDIDQALFYFNTARGGGNDMASYQLGRIHSDPVHGVYDLDMAAAYFTDATKAGNDYAEYALGKIYLNREYSGYSAEKGIEHMERVAENGNQYAQLSLGCIYLKGEHVPRDQEKAEKYLGQAAEQGNEVAQSIMDNMNGSVVPRANGLGKQAIRDMNQAFSSGISALRRMCVKDHSEWLNIQKHHELERQIEAENTMEI